MIKYRKPSILFFDIEVSPHTGYFWGHIWQTDVIKILKVGKIMCFAYKWYGKKVRSVGWPDFKRDKEKNTVRKLRDLLDKADLVIAHNGKKFDVRWFNTRLLYYKIPLPSPYRVSDTRTEAKKYLNAPSNKLDDLSNYYGIGKKLEHEGLDLWLKCLKGNQKAWRKMLRYCRKDVDLDAQFFEVIKPFVENRAIYIGNCNHCGSDDLQSRGYDATKKKRHVQCRSCGGWSTLKNK